MELVSLGVVFVDTWTTKELLFEGFIAVHVAGVFMAVTSLLVDL